MFKDKNINELRKVFIGEILMTNREYRMFDLGHNVSRGEFEIFNFCDQNDLYSYCRLFATRGLRSNGDRIYTFVKIIIIDTDAKVSEIKSLNELNEWFDLNPKVKNFNVNYKNKKNEN